jgi:two-component system NtrC family sensor kinase
MPPIVLIIDDSLTVRMDLADVFEAAGFQRRLCGSAAEARAVLATERVSVVVLDVQLPDADGVQLLGEIRASPALATLPILMLSTRADVEVRLRGLRIAADDYVGKPYDAGYLVASAKALIQARTPVQRGTATVLVIDDSATVRDELRRALEHGGYAVLDASSGEEGLRIAAVSRPMAVIVDGVMPGMDGVTVIRRIRLDPALRGMACVLLTGEDVGGAELEALDAGADAFVRKEQNTDVVLARLAAVLRRASRTTGEIHARPTPRRILVVDDSETYLQEVARTLRSDSYDVVMARSGEEAIEILAKQAVDCVLLDVVMPGLGGEETCRRIKSSSALREIPLIMVTSNVHRDAMIEGLAAGADDYVAKSSPPEVLKARVHAQIWRKQFEDESRRRREDLLRGERELTAIRIAREVAEAEAAREREREREAAQAVLLQTLAELRRSNEELGHFAYIASHDLQEPLRMVVSYTQLLARRYKGKLDADADEFIAFAVDGASRMQRLIQDLLLYSRTGTAELNRRPVSSEQALDRALAKLRGAIEQGGAVVTHGPLPTVWADEPQLVQLFHNLIGNGIKYQSAGVPTVHISAATSDEATWQFSVSDNGIGIESQYFERIFRMFQRLHKPTEFTGTGIGLAICKKIIERHNGRISVESQLGRGSTFHFALPGSEAR